MNNLKVISAKIKEHSSKFRLLFILIVITALIAYYKVRIQMEIGPMWDAFDFLADAAYFAGQGYGYIDLLRLPLLPFLTSLFFRLGYSSEVTILAIDGVLFVFGVIGVYLFLKIRFNDIKSFLGALIFISFPVVLLWVGIGYTDIASTSFSIWALYLTVLAVNKDSKFFYLSFPVATLAFLTRFPAAIIIFPMILYILINRRKLENFRNIFIGIVLSLLVMVPVFIFFYNTFGNPLYPFFNFFGSSSASTSTGGIEAGSYNTDPFFYVTNMIYSLNRMDFLNSSSWGVIVAFLTVEILILCSVLMGICIYLYKILKSQDLRLKNLKNPLKLKKSKITKISAIILIFLIFIDTLGQINYLLSDFIFFILCFMVYTLLKNEKLRNLDLDFLFLSWLFSYMIFNSFYHVKVYRYFIPMAPAFVYFIIVGLSQFSPKIKYKIKNIRVTSILSILLILIVLFSINSYLYKLKNDPIANGENLKIYPTEKWFEFEIVGETHTGKLYFENSNINDLKNVTDWLENYDPNYKKKVIYTDNFWPQLNWYLKTNIKSFQDQDKNYIDAQLKNQNADYYINMNPNVKLNDYIKVAEFKTSFGIIVIYKKQE